MVVVISALNSVRQPSSMVFQRILRPIWAKKSFLSQIGGAGS